LSQLVEQTGPWRRVIEEAWKVCQFDTDTSLSPASYDNLLDYYNQRHHPRLNRWLIKGALEKLGACSFESVKSPPYADYEDHFQRLSRQIDPTSSTERKFLDYLHTKVCACLTPLKKLLMASTSSRISFTNRTCGSSATAHRTMIPPCAPTMKRSVKPSSTRAAKLSSGITATAWKN